MNVGNFHSLASFNCWQWRYAVKCIASRFLYSFLHWNRNWCKRTKAFSKYLKSSSGVNFECFAYRSICTWLTKAEIGGHIHRLLYVLLFLSSSRWCRFCSPNQEEKFTEKMNCSQMSHDFYECIIITTDMDAAVYESVWFVQWLWFLWTTIHTVTNVSHVSNSFSSFHFSLSSSHMPCKQHYNDHNYATTFRFGIDEP